jgi:hypothetical protein
MYSCDLNYVDSKKQPHKIYNALCIFSAFGVSNVALIASRDSSGKDQ